MDVKIRLDQQSVGVYNHNLRRMIEITKQPTENVMRDQARLLCRSLAYQTERKGMPKKPTKHATDIARNIYNIYSLNVVSKRLLSGIRGKWGEKAANRLQQYLISEDTQKAENMIESAFGRKVQLQKWDKGKAHQNWKKNPRSKQRVLLIGDIEQNKNRIKRYIRKQIKNIGNAKSGWARAAEDLGGVKNTTRGIEGWAKRKTHKTSGRGTVTGTGAKTVATVINNTKYGFNRSALRKALAYQGRNMEKQLEKMMRDNWRNINKAQRSGIKAGRAISKF